MRKSFELVSDYTPSGDQASAIKQMMAGLSAQEKYQILLGVTGSGKTFTMANVIAQTNRPTLIMTHNKTLATQLYHEFQAYFPNNAVEYFVSYYDYYQPEAYMAARDLFIEKDTSINDELDKLRLAATRSLFEREDVIIISSVSCIYGLGSPEAYAGMLCYVTVGEERSRESIMKKLIDIQYKRNDFDFHRGSFRVRGDTVEVFPAYEDFGIRIEMFGDEVEGIYEIDSLTGKVKAELTKIAIYPSSHYVTPEEDLPLTIKMIGEELEVRLQQFRDEGKLVEAQRLEQRTRFDIEMLEETGRCTGIENYSRIMTRRTEGEPPPTLIDYFPKDALVFLDESHVTLPQIGGMYKGDRSRKENLVGHGFRLPSAMDNRPLQYEEFDGMLNRMIYVSATPGDREMAQTGGKVIEQVIRPTGLLDPPIEIRPIEGQVEEMFGMIRDTVMEGDRVLLTTLTKRMAEDLTDYYAELGIKVKYLHSDIDTIERSEIIRDLRLGEFDVLVGINLLREGLDLPEVSLIGIFDADKEGFLRSYRSLIQTAGRAARNSKGRVIMFADRITKSMQQCLDETERRRDIQIAHNTKHGITPTTIIKKIQGKMVEDEEENDIKKPEKIIPKDIHKEIRNLEKEMKKAAADLNFEKAAELRDDVKYLKEFHLGLRT